MLNIYANPLFEPEYFLIKDWNNPKDSAVPQWISIWHFDGKYYAHPQVIRNLFEQALAETGLNG